MRVALVCPYSLSVPGGVQGQVLGLARAFDRLGHRSLVIAPVDGPVPGSVDDIVGVGRSVPVPANGSVARLSITPLAVARTVGALRRFGPDVVHLHEPLAPGPTWAALARPGSKVGTFHRAGNVAGGGLLSPAAKALASRLTVRTAVSEAARATAKALVGGEYRIIGNGVELERFTGVAQHGASDQAAPTVLFVGRHEPRKGLEVLVRAFSELDRSVAVRLWIAGEGRKTAELRSRLAGDDRVAWLGRLDDDDLAARMRAADVLCAPALGAESFGIVLVEAMAARAVVVASDVPGYSAVVSSYGVLVPPGDARALAGALSSVLADVGARRGCASARSLDEAAAHARQWSMDAVAARYLEAYELAIRSRDTPVAP